MRIPSTMEELDEAHAAFGKATGEETVIGIFSDLVYLGSVFIEYVLGFG